MLRKVFGKIIETSKKNSYWNLWVLVVIFVPLIWYVNYKRNPIEKGYYTIGYATHTYWPIVSHKKISYSYKIYEKTYEGSQVYNDVKVPERYLVQFSLEDPCYSDIFQDIPVPDSIKEAPAEGWKELPEWAKKNK